MSDPQFSSDLLALWAEDAHGHLDALDRCLLTLERSGLDPEVVAAVLGPLHTLKGNSGMMGFGGVKDYVHRLEDAFERLRDGRLPPDGATWDRLLMGAAALREAVQAAAQAIAARAAAAKLEAAVKEGLMSQEVYGSVSEAYRFLMGLRLRLQLRLLETNAAELGRRPREVPVDELGPQPDRHDANPRLRRALGRRAAPRAAPQ